MLYHGSADARDFLAQHEFYFAEPFVSKPDAVRLRRSSVTKFHVLITTYEVVLKDIAVLSKLKWRTLIVDEVRKLGPCRLWTPRRPNLFVSASLRRID